MSDNLDVFLILRNLITDKKTQAKKVNFSTDLTISARNIFNINRTWFQLEFVFRDAKQFTGLTHSQARNKEAQAFAFNASLSSVNIAKVYDLRKGTIFRLIAMSAKHENLR